MLTELEGFPPMMRAKPLSLSIFIVSKSTSINERDTMYCIVSTGQRIDVIVRSLQQVQYKQLPDILGRNPYRGPLLKA